MARRRIAPVVEQLEPRLTLSSMASVGPPLQSLTYAGAQDATLFNSSVHGGSLASHQRGMSLTNQNRQVSAPPVSSAGPTVAITGPTSGALLSGTTPTISGIAGIDPGDSIVTIKIYAGTSIAGAPVQTLSAVPDSVSGVFTVTAGALPQGPYTLQASQTDGAGHNASSAAVSYITFNTLPGDANGDGQVNFADYAVLSNEFGQKVTSGPAGGDFNFDGTTNFADFTILSDAFGHALLVTPTNLSLTTLSSNSIQVAWSDDSAIATGFHIYRSTNGGNYSLVASLPANAVTFTDSGLASGTTYAYEVSAFDIGDEAVSAPASAATMPASANPVNIYTKSMTSFTELDIDGTAASDSILVTQSGGILSITANGQLYTYANTFGDLVIRGFAGDDQITVDSSVNIATLLYGGDGNDTLVNRTSGKATIVDIDSFGNVLTGNGVNTSYWCNPGDVVNASAVEIANSGVNRVANFYQPFATSVVSRDLYGQNLADPTDSGGENRLTSNSFWGTGAVMSDVNQGTIGDCYYLASLAALANNENLKFMNTGVDLGDGTYAIRFVRSGVTSFVRVDGDLSDSYFAHPGASGNMWAMMYEKAYAFFRTGANTYASLDLGFQGSAFSDLGFAYLNISATNADSVILAAINNALSGGFALAAGTKPTIVNGASVIGSHCYSILGAYRDGTGTVMIQMRNPWGIDGIGNDGNPNDGLVTISYADFAANFYSLTYTNS